MVVYHDFGEARNRGIPTITHQSDGPGWTFSGVFPYVISGVEDENRAGCVDKLPPLALHSSQLSVELNRKDCGRSSTEGSDLLIPRRYENQGGRSYLLSF